MNRLLLLDGNALLHRAYHALPPLTTSAGKPGGAIYGFISMLIRLQIDFKPYGFAIAFDRPKPTFRNEMFKEYQSQRPPMEEALVSQIQTVHDAVKGFGMGVYEMDGYEADDVIGTIVKQLTADSRQLSAIDQVIIVTGDRDILQLVEDEKVLVYMPIKGLTEAKLYGEKEVIERLGVAPEKIADWKGLCGDSSDNYPGVPGVGPKTATDLINTFGSVMALYEAIDNGTATLTQRVKDKLLAGKDSALLSKNLATIRTDAPIDFHLEDCAVPSFDTPQVRAILTELGFPSLLKRIAGIEPASSVGNEPKKEKAEKKKKDEKEQMGLF